MRPAPRNIGNDASWRSSAEWHIGPASGKLILRVERALVRQHLGLVGSGTALPPAADDRSAFTGRVTGSTSWGFPVLSGGVRDALAVRQAPLQYLAGRPPREASVFSGLPHR